MSTTWYFEVPKRVPDRKLVSFVCEASGWRRAPAEAANSEKNQVLTDGRNFLHFGTEPFVGADGRRYGTFERFGANDEGGVPEALGAFSEHDEESLEGVLGAYDEDDEGGEEEEDGEEGGGHQPERRGVRR